MTQRRFWLVQRLYYSPVADFKDKFPNAKVTSNPFGYGRLGEYALDYMGAAEFEWGAIPKAGERLSKGELAYAQHEYNSHQLLFMFLKDEGDPFNDWRQWADGTVSKVRPAFDGKEPPYGLKRRLEGKENTHDHTDVWWSLEDNIMWSFVEADGSSHLQKMIESMETVKSEFLR